MRKFEIELSGKGTEDITTGDIANAIGAVLRKKGLRGFAVGTREVFPSRHLVLEGVGKVGADGIVTEMTVTGATMGAPSPHPDQGWNQLEAILMAGGPGACARAEGVLVMSVRDQNPQGLWRARLLVSSPEDAPPYFIEEGDEWPQAWRHLQWAKATDDVPERMTAAQWSEIQAVDEPQK